MVVGPDDGYLGETFPMSLPEAYACGKPVITSEIGGLKNLVKNGVTGLSFDPGNIRELANSILYLVDNDYKAREIGLKGKQFVKENFIIEKVADKLEQLYRELNGL